MSGFSFENENLPTTIIRAGDTEQEMNRFESLSTAAVAADADPRLLQKLPPNVKIVRLQKALPEFVMALPHTVFGLTLYGDEDLSKVSDAGLERFFEAWYNAVSKGLNVEQYCMRTKDQRYLATRLPANVTRLAVLAKNSAEQMKKLPDQRICSLLLQDPGISEGVLNAIPDDIVDIDLLHPNFIGLLPKNAKKITFRYGDPTIEDICALKERMLTLKTVVCNSHSTIPEKTLAEYKTVLGDSVNIKFLSQYGEEDEATTTLLEYVRRLTADTEGAMQDPLSTKETFKVLGLQTVLPAAIMVSRAAPNDAQQKARIRHCMALYNVSLEALRQYKINVESQIQLLAEQGYSGQYINELRQSIPKTNVLISIVDPESTENVTLKAGDVKDLIGMVACIAMTAPSSKAAPDTTQRAFDMHRMSALPHARAATAQATPSAAQATTTTTAYKETLRAQKAAQAAQAADERSKKNSLAPPPPI